MKFWQVYQMRNVGPGGWNLNGKTAVEPWNVSRRYRNRTANSIRNDEDEATGSFRTGQGGAGWKK